MEQKKRIEIIDIAKAITIFFVIMGHTTPNLDSSLFRRTIYSFHMPLFFILAGLSIKPKAVSGWKEWWAFIRKNILALVVPYMIWALVYSQFSYRSFLQMAYGSWEALNTMGTLTSLWYLPCFFITRILVQLVINLLLKINADHIKISMTISGIVLAVGGFFIPHPEAGVFWCADIAVMAAGFVLFGMGIRETFLIAAQQKTIWLTLSFVVSLGLFFLCTYGRGDALYLSLMCKADNGNAFWFFLIAMLGSVAVLSLTMLIFRISRESRFQFDTKVFTYIGSHTMGIYLLHKPFLQEVVVPMVSGWFGANCPFELVALVATIITLIYSVVLCMIIEKFIPQLLGQFPRNE